MQQQNKLDIFEKATCNRITYPAPDANAQDHVTLVRFNAKNDFMVLAFKSGLLAVLLYLM